MRILIADDNERLRSAIRNLLSREADFEICGEASDGPDTLRKTRELNPELVLLDISMPGSNGFDIARLLRQQFPASRILVMSQNDTSLLLPFASEIGVHGCIDKARLAPDLVKSIKQLQAGGAGPARGQG